MLALPSAKASWTPNLFGDEILTLLVITDRVAGTYNTYIHLPGLGFHYNF